MNAWRPIAAILDGPDRDGEAAFSAPFRIDRPPHAAARTPLIYASPHSGRIYPRRLMAASRLDSATIRRSEDAFVDWLIDPAPRHGATVIAATLARAFLDVNREPWELDPAMFEDELPQYAQSRTARIAAGLGSIARIVCEGEEIYAGKLCFAEARGRVETIHRPYHEALACLVAQARAEQGLAVLIDWHSMPSAAAQTGAGGAADIVLGDRYSGACSPVLSRLVERQFQEMGYVVARNAPYAGGYTTERYGRPGRKVHALQIELNRALYLDEAALEPTAGFEALKADLDRLTAVLASTDWSVF